MSASFFPLFDLEVRTPRLLLRVPRDEDFPGLIAAIDAGIHEDDEMPFAVPWTDGEPRDRARKSAQHWWEARASWSMDAWDLQLAVFVNDVPVGIQGMGAKRFPVLRTVSTGSWLTRSEQRKGYGKEMRTAVLHLAFVGLGAEVAESSAYTDNPASAGVSRALGYVENGVDRYAPRDQPKDLVRYRLTAKDWPAVPRTPVTVSGLDLSMFGVEG